MKNYLFFGLIFFVMTNGYAQVQSDYTYFDFNNLSLPESPIANNLLKFEEIPVDVATGIPQINIPLFSFEIDGLIIPISLSYHAAGIKVNDFSSAVGLNWTLNAGGGIYRKVNSLPDEEGWTIANKGPLPQSFYEGKNIRSHNYRILMSGGPQADGTSGYAALRDHNPDDFSYSIMNKSGKFILDFEGDIIKNQADEFEIDLNGFNFPVFKDQKGNKFFFGDNKEYGFRRFSGITQIEKENDSIIFPIIENSNQYENGHPTAWMLSKIETKNNKKIFFEYEDYSVSENRNILKLSHSITTGMECYYGKQTPVSFASSHTLLLMNPLSYEPEYKMQLLSAIKSESFDIYFYYSLDDNLSEWQKKLDKIEIKDNFKNEIKEIHFEYGIYNGDSRLRLDRIYEKKENKELPGYYFNYNNGALPSRYSLAQDFFGYYNGQNQNNSLAPRNDWTFNRFQYKYASFYNNKTGIRTHNGNYLKTGIIKEIIYPTGGKTKFDFEPNSEFRNGIEKYTGGLRIRKIEDIDNTNEVVNTRKYQYQNLIGISYETDFFSTISEVYGNRTSITYHSDFVKHKSTLNSGYHYGKVAEIVINKYDNYKKEYLFKSNYSYGILNNLLESEIYFKNNDTLKLIEYNYRVFGDLKEINWNILGERECVVEENSNQSFITYRKGQNMIASGNIVKLPTQIITTDYLGPNRAPVTTIQKMDYDNKTLLKTYESFDTRFTRIGKGSHMKNNPNDKKIETFFYYSTAPNNEGLPIDFPKGLLLKKEVFNSTSAGSNKILGQAMEYDSQGNVKKIFYYNKGEKSNNSIYSYVPKNYEEILFFIYEDGKPVQTQQKKGTPTSFIWNKKGDFIAAKIEGIFRTQIDSQIIRSIEDAVYSDFSNNSDSPLTTLRNMFLNHNHSVLLTTYTFAPFMGVETITDPKGNITFYEYDSFGRFIRARDSKGKIINETEYNYALENP